ncbi:MAG: NAD(P)-binding protein [Spirochaetales bacterium]|nr:NAD(P)-binding protein [Spirochaetales bacterium]
MSCVILGAGPAGLGASFFLKKNKISSVIYEKDSDWGGLCGCFNLGDFRFDKFVHFSFSENIDVNDIFLRNSYISHPPESSNYYKGTWLRHPVQNNLFPLSTAEKVEVIKSFATRADGRPSECKNYEEWLRLQYGDYFAENFPLKYTRKYWTVEANQLETKWVGIRMHVPDLAEVIDGAIAPNTENKYYTKVMRYPEKGGYRRFLEPAADVADKRFGKKAVFINPKAKKVEFEDGSSVHYEFLISSLPLPEIVKILPDVPSQVTEAAKKLQCSSGTIVSLGFNQPDIAKHLWFYVYDEEILPARAYSPSLKSSDNVPCGKSSLQFEIYRNQQKNNYSEEYLLDHVIDSGIKMGIFNNSDIEVSDVRTIKYANVIFDHEIYRNRKIVLDYLKQQEIISCGRFGEWGYLWSDQSLLSGKKAAQMVLDETL